MSDSATQQENEWTVARDGDGVCIMQDGEFIHIPSEDVALARSQMRKRQPSETPDWLEAIVIGLGPNWSTGLSRFGLLIGVIVGSLFTSLLTNAGMAPVYAAAAMLVVTGIVAVLARWS